MWAQLKIKVKVNAQPRATFPSSRSRTPACTCSAGAAPSPTPRPPSRRCCAIAAKGVGYWNFGGVKNDKFDALAAQSSVEPDAKKRRGLIERRCASTREQVRDPTLLSG